MMAQFISWCLAPHGTSCWSPASSPVRADRTVGSVSVSALSLPRFAGCNTHGRQEFVWVFVSELVFVFEGV